MNLGIATLPFPRRQNPKHNRDPGPTCSGATVLPVSSPEDACKTKTPSACRTGAEGLGIVSFCLSRRLSHDAPAHHHLWPFLLLGGFSGFRRLPDVCPFLHGALQRLGFLLVDLHVVDLLIGGGRRRGGLLGMGGSRENGSHGKECNGEKQPE